MLSAMKEEPSSPQEIKHTYNPLMRHLVKGKIKSGKGCTLYLNKIKDKYWIILFNKFVREENW